jgi:hypothetical protein
VNDNNSEIRLSMSTTLLKELERLDRLELPSNSDVATVVRMDALNEAVKICDLSADETRLLCGEMTAQEMRTVKAVLDSRVRILQRMMDEL